MIVFMIVLDDQSSWSLCKCSFRSRRIPNNQWRHRSHIKYCEVWDHHFQTKQWPYTVRIFLQFIKLTPPEELKLLGSSIGELVLLNSLSKISEPLVLLLPHAQISAHFENQSSLNGTRTFAGYGLAHCRSPPTVPQYQDFFHDVATSNSFNKRWGLDIPASRELLSPLSLTLQWALFS